jgi:hypothetical protein
VESFCECCNEPSGSIKVGRLLSSLVTNSFSRRTHSLMLLTPHRGVGYLQERTARRTKGLFHNEYKNGEVVPLLNCLNTTV